VVLFVDFFVYVGVVVLINVIIGFFGSEFVLVLLGDYILVLVVLWMLSELVFVWVCELFGYWYWGNMVFEVWW